ncbi:hypothetical protein [Jeotgalibacillus sp. R-1-5s-1]|uniref:hypothetical protein n=1 Tax=Jeotgalibacillus sp. R-1-5s-1 TaxID=2555897 RepID=UPI00106B8A6B|nr:hypothetical protein [Jeotgalibacillus sp. R-1-5s-1]TFD97640.1 hypothetical protein E2491_09460 [Jeotgalibacillus sp. R-1-5s-1]
MIYDLNPTFLFFMEWGFVLAAAAVILFLVLAIRRAPRMKAAFLWLIGHIVLTIIAYLTFWAGLGAEPGSSSIENISDQVQFLFGVAGLVWLTGMLCFVLGVQMLKDQFSTKKYTPIQKEEG